MKTSTLFLIAFLVGCSTSPPKTTEPIQKSLQESCFISADELSSIADSNDQQFLDNKYYDVIYDNTHIQPYLVEYKLNYSKNTHHLERGRDYPDHFVKDGRVLASAGNNDYLRSGWDKGHLAPAEDFSFSVDSARETFLYSNVSPQDPSFNRHGSWSKLEFKVRERATDEEIQVITGPIVFLGSRMPSSVHSPHIPKYFYKIILSNKEENCLKSLFILENNSNSKDFCRDNRLEQFSNLPASLQLKLQNNTTHGFCD